MDAKWFAGRLRELREERGFSRGELAGRAGIKPSAVRDLEQGQYGPNWETVVALCLALGVRCDAFLQEPAERPPPGRGRPRKAPVAEEPGPARKGSGAGRRPKKGRGG
jgi:transcriptional regulator with XRE-family HTH domain